MFGFTLKRSFVNKSNSAVYYLVVVSVCLFFLTAFCIFYSFNKTKKILAFPGALGFGSATEGGRYGEIIFVTNLNDTEDVTSSTYVGSLRWALNHDLPEDPANPYAQRRFVVFRIGGIINLVDRIVMDHPFVTIAGQTAPGDGIVLKGDTFEIDTHDVIIRGLRVRVGDEGVPSCCRDGIGVSTDSATGDVYNIIVDHSSVSWAIDENMSIWKDPTKPRLAHDITFQWNMIGEGLYNSIHVDEGATGTDPHSMGMILENASNVSIHRNLFVHNWGRNPRVSGIENSEIVNNVVYGWSDAALEFSEDKSTTNVLGNYFKAGVGHRHNEISIPDSMNNNSVIFLQGNFTDDPAQSNELYASNIDKPAGFLMATSQPFLPNLKADSAINAYKNILCCSGAISPVRDSVDQRLVNDVINRTGRIIDSQNEVGGWPNYASGQYPQDSDGDGVPDSWELMHGLNPTDPSDASNYYFRTRSGYTWIEEYVNSLITSP